MKTLQPILSGGASLGKDHRGGSRGRSPHRCTVLVVLMFVATLARAATNDLSGLLQKGLFEEEANRNLDAASAAYQTLVTQFDKDRQIGATAIFRLGEVYRKQGKTNEAAAQYERIVRDFAEQTTLVTLSRQNLAGLVVKSGSIPTPAATSPTDVAIVQQALVITKASISDLQDQITRYQALPETNRLASLCQLFANDAVLGADCRAALEIKARLNNLLLEGLNTNHPSFIKQQKQLASLEHEIEAKAQKQISSLPQTIASLEAQVETLQRQGDLYEKRMSSAVAPALPDASQLSKMSQAEIRQVLPALVPDQLLMKLLEQLGATETKLAELKQDFGPDHPEIKRLVAVEKTVNRQIDERVAGIIKALELRGTASDVSKSTTAVTTVVDEEESEIRRIQAMIQNSPDLINAPSGDPFMTPLCRAASKGQLRVARFLLDNGALVDQPSGRENSLYAGRTALHYAGDAGHRAMVELLVSRNANVNDRSKSGYTALHIAAQKGFQSVAEALVNGRADINAPANWRETPLRLAAERGHAGMVAFLIAKGADVNAPDGNDMTPLHWAASQGHREALQHLVTAKAGLNALDKDGQTALSLAAGAGHLEIVKALLQAGADPNAGKANPPVHSAIKARAVDVVQALLKAGADANLAARVTGRLRYPDGAERDLPAGDTVTPLALAMSNYQMEIAKILLAAKADPNGKRLDDVPLVFSALSDADVLQAFLAAGANPNAVDVSRQPSNTLLGRAWNPRIFRLLLAAGAKPNALSDGCAPLIWAANWEKRDAAKERAEALLAGGADVHVALSDGRRALHLAAQRQNRELAQVLLAFRADVNARDNQGLTPLDFALGKNRPQDGLVYTVTSPISRFAGDPVDLGENSVAALLRQHGGLDNLPDLRSISVSRAASGYRATVFQIGTNGWSHYTLTELLAQQLGLLSAHTQGVVRDRRGQFRSNIWGQSPIRFPDFSGIVIHRPTKDGKSRTQIPVVFLLKTEGHEKQTDWLLMPGDTVEIPEADHPVSDSWPGPSAADLVAWTNVLSRSVTLVIGGKKMEFRLATEVEIFTSSVPERVIINPASFMVRAVLDQSKLVRYSSDLTRVKVSRPQTTNRKRQEWVVDCSDGAFPDLWLQDGDVVEVPDKP